MIANLFVAARRTSGRDAHHTAERVEEGSALLDRPFWSQIPADQIASFGGSVDV